LKTKENKIDEFTCNLIRLSLLNASKDTRF